MSDPNIDRADTNFDPANRTDAGTGMTGVAGSENGNESSDEELETDTDAEDEDDAVAEDDASRGAEDDASEPGQNQGAMQDR